ncbi:MAG: MFS transporter [Chloroflexia bacterium]
MRIGRRFTGLWHHPDFMKLWAGQAISEFGSRITRDGLPLAAVISLHATPGEMGLLFAIGSAPVLLVGLPAGVWVDRLRRRPIMIAADIARALVLGSIPAAAILGYLRIEQLYIVSAVAGVLTVFFEVAGQSYLPALVSREQIIEGNSKLGASSSLAEIGGPSLAGGLVQALTAPIAILFDALSYLASAASLALISKPEPPPEPKQERANIWLDVTEGLRLVLGHPLLRSIAGGSGIRNFFGGFYGALYSLYAVATLGISPGVLGLLITAGGLGALPGALLAERLSRRYGVGRTIIGALAFSVAFAPLTPLAGAFGLPPVGFLLAAQFFGDFGLVIYFINALSLRQSLVPDRLLGRANASMQFLEGGVAPLGALLAGALAEGIGPRATLWIASAGFAVSALWLLRGPLRSLA